MKTRRDFLSETFSTFTGFGAGAALVALGERLRVDPVSTARDKLVLAQDESTGLKLVRLPEGFRYVTYSWTGDVMSDGVKTPALHDGMGVVAEQDGVVTLVRNHELSSDGQAWVHAKGSPFDKQAQGGCTTLRFDGRQGKWLESFVSLSGTSRNCAGGVTPWGTWLTAEETVLGVDSIDHYKGNKKRRFEKEHGWVFEVDPNGVASPEPIKGMGRFVHEAVAVDRDTGIIYETEDRGTAGFLPIYTQTKWQTCRRRRASDCRSRGATRFARRRDARQKV